MIPQEIVNKLIEGLSKTNEYFKDVDFEVSPYFTEEETPIFVEQLKKYLPIEYLKKVELSSLNFTDPNLVMEKKLAVKNILWQLKVVNDMTEIKRSRQHSFHP